MIFGPIDQLGWRSACSGVAALIAASDQVRNGPPEAVSITRLTSSRRPALSAWKIALCSESTGSTVAPDFAARRMNRLPAQTRHSLLASATVAPRSIAASVGFKPDRAADRRHDPVGRTLRGFEQSVLAGRGLDAAAGQCIFEIAVGGGIGDHGKLRAELARDVCERRRVAPRGDGLDPKRSGSRLIRSSVLAPTEPVAPENGDAARRCGRLRFRPAELDGIGIGSAIALTTPADRAAAPFRPPRNRPIRQPTRAAAQKPSRRSIKPP